MALYAISIIKMCWTTYSMCICLKLRASLPYCHLCFVCPDVYSYDEDDMVLDSKLPEHLSHFGIDMMTMEKVSSVFLPFFSKSTLFYFIPLSLIISNIKSTHFPHCFAKFNTGSSSYRQKYQPSTLCFTIEVVQM